MSQLKKIFWISLFVKLGVAALLPITNDEAYYWVWSRYPQLSYYDHPPITAWLFGAGEWLGSSFVRWPGVLLAHTTLALWLKILQKHLSLDQQRQWLWLALLSPLVGGSGIIVTPDLPLMFFYALSLLLFFRWKNSGSLTNGLLLGFAVGAGFSSKYMMVIFVLSLLPLVVFDVSVRRIFWRSLPIIFLGVVLGSSPVWIWNLTHDFASFKFQATHGLGRKFWKPSWTIEYIGAQVALIFPVVLYWALRGRKNLPIIFSLLAIFPLGFFLLTTYRGYVEANWPIAAYPAIFALAVTTYPLSLRSLQATIILWGLVMASGFVVIVAQPPWSKALKFREFHQFDRTIEVARSLAPVYARSYQMAAKMHFELKRPVYKLKGMNRKDFFDYLEASEPSELPYYVVIEKGDILPASYKARGDQVIETIPVDDRFEIIKVDRQ